MELKKTFKELVKYGSQNETNRKQVIESAIWVVALLELNHGKKIPDEDLNKITGGEGYRLTAPMF